MTEEKMLRITEKLFEPFLNNFNNQVVLDDISVYEMDNFFRVQGELTIDDVNINNAFNTLKRDFKKYALSLRSIKEIDDKVYFAVEEYTYQVQVGLEAIADEVESKLGEYIYDLRVSEIGDVPVIEFEIFNTVGRAQRDIIHKTVDDIVESFEAISSDEIEFDSYNEIMEMIKNG